MAHIHTFTHTHTHTHMLIQPRCFPFTHTHKHAQYLNVSHTTRAFLSLSYAFVSHALSLSLMLSYRTWVGKNSLETLVLDHWRQKAHTHTQVVINHCSHTCSPIDLKCLLEKCVLCVCVFVCVCVYVCVHLCVCVCVLICCICAYVCMYVCVCVCVCVCVYREG